MNREELHKKFESIYQSLNSEQKEAVNHIYGPVLVIAGPGTGKTQILSARIGKILLETDYMPDNILCLTYTDAGRVAMRKRLQEMIGADAYRVQIHTFHSFCNQIIQENVSFFNKSSLDTISEIEAVDLLKKVIDELPNENPLKRFRGDAYYEIGRLKALFSIMKREGWTSDFIKIKVDEYIESLATNEEYIYKNNGKSWKKGDLKLAKIKEETEKMMLLKCGTDAFDHYQQLMKEHHRYDFDDMINWVIQAFETNENILLDNQEKFQFILVDEFQDTSGSQNKLIELLTKNVESPNIFVVGDDDQSIYRFQGANVENIEAYKNAYAETLRHVVLKTNYRSTQAILDSSKSVIDNNQERLSAKDARITKDLVAGNAVRLQAAHTPMLMYYENPFQEMVGITSQINMLIHEQHVKPESIAVIYTTNKTGTEFIKFFKTKQIPYFSKTKENLFEIPLAKKMLKILKYIALETSMPYSADDLLFEILHFDIYTIPPFEIAKASVRVGDMRYEHKTSLRTYLQDWIHTANPSLFENKPNAGIIEITSLLEKWIRDSFNSTVIQVVENVYLEGKFLEFALTSNDKMWHLEVLRSLIDFIKEEMHRKPDHTIASLLDVIDVMEEQKIHISLFRTFGSDNGVNLLTAHSSKGLEFEYVFLMNATADTWEKKSSRSSTYKIPDTVFETSSLSKVDTSNHEENRRLFFVAMTRAENYLNISWSQKDDKGKVTEPSVYISEITDKLQLQREKQFITEETINEFLHIYLLQNKQPIIDEGEKEYINSLLLRFEMNVTALNNYLECPLKFYYQNMLRVPTGRSEASEFGSAVHYALERLFKKMQEQESQFPPLEDCIEDFKWFMNRNRESFTPQAMKRRLDYGEQILTALYEKNIESWNKVVAIERMFKSIVVEGVPLKGKLDKMEFDYNNVVVVDYKTGDPDKSKDRLKPPTAKDPKGGAYWRQAVFYKILVDNYKSKDYKVSKTEFQYVEPNKQGEYLNKEIIPTLEDIEIVKGQIKDTWNKIQSRDFYKGCGEETCHWCNFVKDNRQYRELVEMTKEQEEDLDEQ